MIYTLIDENDQTISFDCVTSFNQTSTVSVTEHPVETKAPITDHVYVDNDKFTINGIVSDFNFFNPLRGEFGATVYFDANGGIVSNATITNLQSSVKEALLILQKAGSLVKLVISSSPNEPTEVYNNCVLQSITFEDSPENGEALFFNINLVQIQRVAVRVEATTNAPVELRVPLAAGTTAAGDAAATGKVELPPEAQSAVDNANQLSDLQRRGQSLEAQANANIAQATNANLLAEELNRIRALDIPPEAKDRLAQEASKRLGN